MKAVEELIKEHKTLRVMLGIMGRICGDIGAGKGFDDLDVENIIEFLRVYVDRCHHGKEENCLFPALLSAGIPHENGPVGQMLREHATGRGFIREIQIGLENHRHGIAGSDSIVASGMNNYIKLLQSHMQKEEKILFPMAEKLLSKQLQEGLIKQFEKIEEEVIGHGVHEGYHVWLSRMKTKYNR